MVNVCGALAKAAREGYVETRTVFNMRTGEMARDLYGLPGTGRGRKKKPFFYFNCCPWCGGVQTLDGPYAERVMQCVCPSQEVEPVSGEEGS